MFVPVQDELKVNKIVIKNLLNEERKIKLLAYIKPVIGEEEYFTNGNIYLEKDNNTIFINNKFKDSFFNDREAFIMSSESINSYSGSKESFFGNGNLKQPDALYRNLDNSSGFGVDSAACLEIIVKLDKNEEKVYWNSGNLRFRKTD